MTKPPNDSRPFSDSLADLSAIEREIWQELCTAVDSARHGWHLPILGTLSAEGPELRTVVLRDVDVDSRQFICHTDARSDKITQICNDERVCWLMYDAQQRVQVVARGKATVHRDDDLADTRWASSRLESRRCYLAPHPPGKQLAGADPNLPLELRDRIPTEEESLEGRQHFAVIVSTIATIDWLYLSQQGNLRARFDYAGETPHADWIAA